MTDRGTIQDENTTQRLTGTKIQIQETAFLRTAGKREACVVYCMLPWFEGVVSYFVYGLIFINVIFGARDAEP